MPLIKPHKGESEHTFIDRCLSDEGMKAEFEDKDQRLALCYDLWEKNKETKTMSKEILKRSFPLQQVRVNGKKPKRIEGFAAVYNSLSDEMLGGREIIRPGAFKKTLKDGGNVTALFNHNPDAILGSRKSGTLVLEDRAKGLWMSIEPPDTSTGRDVVELVRRGDLEKCSFAFQVIKDKPGKTEAGEALRELLEVRLFDVSIVTFPAYPEPSIHLQRAILVNDFGLDLDNLVPAMLRVQKGKGNGEDHARIHVARTTLDLLLKGPGENKINRGGFTRINELIKGE